MLFKASNNGVVPSIKALILGFALKASKYRTD
jgi:hypothetical protein